MKRVGAIFFILFSSALMAQSLVGVECPSIKVASGTSQVCTVTLSNKTLADVVVQLQTDNDFISIPGTVTVPAGQSIATFTLAVSVTDIARVGKFMAIYGEDRKRHFIVDAP